VADHVKVTEARLENGLLTIHLVRELPEALRPRKIEIGTNTVQKLGRKAA
jgi:molecular chaperone IbpA